MHFRSLITYVNIYFLLCCSRLSQGQQHRSSGISIGSEYGSTSIVRKTRDGGFSREPSCEELRAMWIFSKRQSRATELTNDIPTYRDPFAYNMWDPYPRARSGGGGFAPVRSPHIYGRIVHDAPWRVAHDSSLPRTRPFQHADLVHMKGPSKAPARRRKLNYRIPGGSFSPLPPLTGSFQQLKELIQNERARELQEQRMAEDAAARTAALQGLPVNTYYGHVVQGTTAQQGVQDMADAYPTTDKGLPNKQAVLTFPNLLLPSTSNFKEQPDFVPPDHIYQHRSYPEIIHAPFSIQPAMFRH